MFNCEGTTIDKTMGIDLIAVDDRGHYGVALRIRDKFKCFKNFTISSKGFPDNPDSDIYKWFNSYDSLLHDGTKIGYNIHIEHDEYFAYVFKVNVPAIAEHLHTLWIHYPNEFNELFVKNEQFLEVKLDYCIKKGLLGRLNPVKRYKYSLLNDQPISYWDENGVETYL